MALQCFAHRTCGEVRGHARLLAFVDFSRVRAGIIYPLPNFHESQKAVKAVTHSDGCEYPPTLYEDGEPERGRPAPLHKLPATHVMALRNGSTDQQKARVGVAGEVRRRSHRRTRGAEHHTQRTSCAQARLHARPRVRACPVEAGVSGRTRVECTTRRALVGGDRGHRSGTSAGAARRCARGLLHWLAHTRRTVPAPVD